MSKEEKRWFVMMYILSNKKNSYGIVNFDHDYFDHQLFLQGSSLKGVIDEPIFYEITKKSNVKKLSNLHIINSTGPELVSNALRKIMEEAAPSEVEFFDAIIYCDGSKIEGFSCIHPLRIVEGFDMEVSEYKLINFDPKNPKYRFYYIAVKDKIEYEPKIARCYELRLNILVNEEIKSALFDNKFKGLVFYRSLDMTPKNRSVYEEIK
jgi:hypothetical protein